MKNETQVQKNENKQQSIPEGWRSVLRAIVEAFKDGNFQLAGIDGVNQLSPEDGQRISRNIESYGAHLDSLPESAWDTSACQWMNSYWDALIDLYTVEEGASDLALSVRVQESPEGYEFAVQSVHVP